DLCPQADAAEIGGAARHTDPTADRLSRPETCRLMADSARSVTGSPTGLFSLRSRQFPNRADPVGQWFHPSISPAVREQHPPSPRTRASAPSASLREGGRSPLVSNARTSRRQTLRQLRPPASTL